MLLTSPVDPHRVGDRNDAQGKVQSVLDCACHQGQLGPVKPHLDASDWSKIRPSHFWISRLELSFLAAQLLGAWEGGQCM